MNKSHDLSDKHPCFFDFCLRAHAVRPLQTVINEMMCVINCARSWNNQIIYNTY
jgi:hypothetical protein